MSPRLVRVILGAVLSLVFASCTENGGSIFYVLEHEKKQPSSTIGKYITVFDVANLSAKSSYYAAAGTIFVGSYASGSLSWLPKTKLTPPKSGALCNALAEFGGDLYGGFIESQGNLGLYKAVGDDFTAPGAGLVTGGIYLAGPDYQVIRLIHTEVGNRLLIVTAKSVGGQSNPFRYYLTSYDGTAYTTLLADLSDMINDATFDGTQYWAVAGSKLYSGAAFPLAENFAIESAAIGYSASDVFQGVFARSTSQIYISSYKRGLYYTTDTGANWTRIKPDDRSGSNVSYLCLGNLELPTGNILLGSDGYGLYYYTPGAVKLERSDDSDMITLDLYDSSIKRLVYDAAHNFVLACTNGKGLWKGTIDPSNPSGVSGWEIQ